MNVADRTINALQARKVVYQQSEGAVLDYTVNWAAWLPASDTISVSSWSVKEGGVTISAQTNTTTTTRAIVTGTPGRHNIINKITTAGGLVSERTITLDIQSHDPEAWDDISGGTTIYVPGTVADRIVASDGTVWQLTTVDNGDGTYSDSWVRTS